MNFIKDIDNNEMVCYYMNIVHINILQEKRCL